MAPAAQPTVVPWDGEIMRDGILDSDDPQHFIDMPDTISMSSSPAPRPCAVWFWQEYTGSVTVALSQTVERSTERQWNCDCRRQAWFRMRCDGPPE